VFRVPDLHGVFLRGWHHEAILKTMSQSDQAAWKKAVADPQATSRVPRHPFGVSGDRVGSFQGSANLAHFHDEVFLMEDGKNTL
jgi:hypothetical protein